MAEPEDGEVLQRAEPPRDAASEVVVVEEGDGEGGCNTQVLILDN